MPPANRKIKDHTLFVGSLFDELPTHPSIERAAEAARAAQEKASVEARRCEETALQFISFGSGSSGNSSYIGDRNAGVIIDAGVDYTHVVTTLQNNGIGMDAVKGILVTHDHGDHIRYVYTIVRRYPHIGVFCTPRCFNGITRRHNVSRRLKDFHRPIYKEFPFKLAGMEITAFDVCHDGTDNVGFYITRGAEESQRFAIATDLGCITPRVEYYMRRARWVVIESNYDAEMLRVGPYPEYLKARIQAANGHLDNTVAARFIASIWTPQLTHLFLCHLSHDNNTPDIALMQMRRAFEGIGITDIGQARETPDDLKCRLQLVALPRHEASPMFYLR